MKMWMRIINKAPRLGQLSGRLAVVRWPVPNSWRVAGCWLLESCWQEVGKRWAVSERRTTQWTARWTTQPTIRWTAWQTIRKLPCESPDGELPANYPEKRFGKKLNWTVMIWLLAMMCFGQCEARSQWDWSQGDSLQLEIRKSLLED